MTFRELLANATAQLAAKGIEDARTEAEVLIMAAATVSRAWLYAHSDAVASPEALACVDEFVQRRSLREPTAYILGRREFYSLDFIVDRRVLIPRPESELLVDEAISASRRILARHSSVVVADVGTGSGAIAVSVAHNVPEATVFAMDSSADALEVARTNCRRHGVDERVKLLHGDLLAPVDRVLDVIVANLPYVKDSDLSSLQPEIGEFEPSLALEGGKAGMDLMGRLLKQAVGRVRDGGTIALEIAWDQGQPATNLAKTCFPFDRVQIRKDLAGHDRLIVIAVGGLEEVSS